MKQKKFYWVRMSGDGFFPMVFFDTKRQCEHSFKHRFSPRDMKAVRVRIVVDNPRLPARRERLKAMREGRSSTPTRKASGSGR